MSQSTKKYFHPWYFCHFLLYHSGNAFLGIKKKPEKTSKEVTESKTKSFARRGFSINKIRNYLISKGVNEKYIKESITKIDSEEKNHDFFSAIKTCKKRRIGPNREEDNRPLFYKKDMSILARAGFNYETSKKILDLSKKDYLNFLKLL